MSTNTTLQERINHLNAELNSHKAKVQEWQEQTRLQAKALEQELEELKKLPDFAAKKKTFCEKLNDCLAKVQKEESTFNDTHEFLQTELNKIQQELEINEFYRELYRELSQEIQNTLAPLKF